MESTPENFFVQVYSLSSFAGDISFVESGHGNISARVGYSHKKTMDTA
jgi:hypothetical protein